MPPFAFPAALRFALGVLTPSVFGPVVGVERRRVHVVADALVELPEVRLEALRGRRDPVASGRGNMPSLCKETGDGAAVTVVRWVGVGVGSSGG